MDFGARTMEQGSSTDGARELERWSKGARTMEQGSSTCRTPRRADRRDACPAGAWVDTGMFWEPVWAFWRKVQCDDAQCPMR
jgi:hypothetical protein